MRHLQARLLFVFVLTIAITSCNKSGSPSSEPAKPASTAPPAQPAAATDGQKPSTEPAPVKKFELKEGAFFPAAQIPTNGSSEFVIQGQSGKFLRVEVEEDPGKSARAAKLTAEYVTGGRKLSPVIPEYCSDEQMYQLTDNSAVRVLLNPAGHKSAVRFSFLGNDDPLMSVGISPEQISVELKGTSSADKFGAMPYYHDCETGESWPARIAFNTEKMQIQIARLEGYKEVYPGSDAMQLLQARLQPGAKPVNAKDLPFANSGDAATIMTARQEVLQGSGWKGWRWVEGSAQDGDYPGNLQYVFEGLTDDGKLFIRVTGALLYPGLHRLAPNNSNGKNEDTRKRQLLETELASADPSTFTPNLNEMDQVIKSLKISR